MNDEVMNKTK